jgi:hypothetical protein
MVSGYSRIQTFDISGNVCLEYQTTATIHYCVYKAFRSNAQQKIKQNKIKSCSE